MNGLYIRSLTLTIIIRKVILILFRSKFKFKLYISVRIEFQSYETLEEIIHKSSGTQRAVSKINHFLINKQGKESDRGSLDFGVSRDNPAGWRAKPSAKFTSVLGQMFSPLPHDWNILLRHYFKSFLESGKVEIMTKSIRNPHIKLFLNIPLISPPR